MLLDTMFILHIYRISCITTFIHGIYIMSMAALWQYETRLLSTKCTDTRHIFGPTIIESIHRDILLKILFLAIAVQKCIINLKQNNIYYGVLT